MRGHRSCFGNCHSKCLSIHDVHYAAIHQSSVAMRPQRQGRTTASTTKVKIQNSWVGHRYDGPTYGFATSPEVGTGATVGPLQIGYPRIQASSQDMEQDVLPCVLLLRTPPPC
jgi:hypothetical protein